jgi:S-DNA-T family DNA segregation ATPase FtsK/SpoIIIE
MTLTKSTYTDYGIDELQELFSNFLINSWSYSKVSAFARNPKAFEMSYIFGLSSKRSATTAAGEAYHAALEYYFTKRKEGKELDLVELEASAFQYLDDLAGNYWKIQKTTPSVEDCKIKATKLVSVLLRNFIREIAVYMADVAEILDVELRHEAFLTINGVDIPLPCHGRIDLRVRLTNGRIAVVDHKSKASYTPEEEIALSIGPQAITYVKLVEEKTGERVDEVWFVENKYSENKDRSAQVVAFKVDIDDNTRALYEALLYEPLKKLIEATSDPDFVYVINDSDNYVDRAELYDFWARTMICEVEDFNVEIAKKDLVSKRLKKIRDAAVRVVSPSVIKNFKENASAFIQYDLSYTNMTRPEKIEQVLRHFGAIVKVAHTLSGYSSETFLLEISAGVKITSVFSHRLDLANALDVEDVRIPQKMLVYQERSYLGIEVARKRDRDLIWDPAPLSGLKIPIGVDNFGNVIVWDLDNHSTPHALVCGQTGSGKSVCVKSTIEYALAGGVKDLIIFDPKFEFGEYNDRAVVLNDIEDIEKFMAALVNRMNERVKKGEKKHTLVVFDEFADAVANSRKGAALDEDEKPLEENLRILLQKGRSSGFRIMAATQRASVKVITGDAKVNFPVQICFRVPRETDSRVVLDEAGAEALAGAGDGLIKSPSYDMVRFQAYYKP